MQARQESGQSIKSYCKQMGISANTYHYWQRRLRASAYEALMAQESSGAEQAVVPSGWAICETERVQKSEANAIVIEIGKCRVAVKTDADGDLLAKVCQTLLALC
jgi:transposase-like protein